PLALYISTSFLFNDPSTTQIYTLSLHDALPISPAAQAGDLPPRRMPGLRPHLPEPHAHRGRSRLDLRQRLRRHGAGAGRGELRRSEEHTSELQSLRHLVCRLLLEKKKKT